MSGVGLKVQGGQCSRSEKIGVITMTVCHDLALGDYVYQKMLCSTSCVCQKMVCVQLRLSFFTRIKNKKEIRRTCPFFTTQPMRGKTGYTGRKCRMEKHKWVINRQMGVSVVCHAIPGGMQQCHNDVHISLSVVLSLCSVSENIQSCGLGIYRKNTVLWTRNLF